MKPTTMKPYVKNTIAVLTGLVLGSVVNMAIVSLSTDQLNLDPNDPEYMIKLGEVLATAPWHMFVYPFLAHALGTLVGAATAASIGTTSQKMKLALGIAVFFLLGGIMASVMIPSPLWFVILDLTCAYIPMGLLSGWVITRRTKK